MWIWPVILFSVIPLAPRGPEARTFTTFDPATSLEVIPYSPYVDSITDLVSFDSVGAYILRLQNFQTRYSFTDSVIQASEWISAKFQSFGYDSVYFQTFPHPENPSSIQRNVVCVKPGLITPQEVIVIGGHYDSVVYGAGANPYVWAPGADDNGSGTSGVLETARVLANIPTDRTIIFVAFAAEEQGLYGSETYADWAASQGMDILLMINMDMIGYEKDFVWFVAIEGNYASRPEIDLAAEIADLYTSLIPQVSYTTAPYSDHWPFLANGYHALMLEESDFNYNNWHRNTDIIDSLRIPYAAQVVELATGLALWIANRPDPPTYLSATPGPSSGSILLTYTPPPQPDVEGYEITYRQGGTTDTLITSDTSVVIEGLQPGVPVVLKARAFDAQGFYSVPSDSVIATPTQVAEGPVLPSPSLRFESPRPGVLLFAGPVGTRGSLTVYDISGRQKIHTTFTLKQTRTVVPLRLKQGVYFAIWDVGTQILRTKVVVIQR